MATPLLSLRIQGLAVAHGGICTWYQQPSYCAPPSPMATVKATTTPSQKAARTRV